MDKYQSCKNKGDKSWNDLAKELGLGNNGGEKLRCWFKRARRNAGDFPNTPTPRFPKASSNEGKSSFTSDGENIFVTYISDHVPSVEEVMKKYSVDGSDWKVEKFEVTDWQMGRKDVQKDLEWVDGVVTGTVFDSGKLSRVWLHRINVKFVRKTEEIRSRNVIKELIEDAKKTLPIHKKIPYPEFLNGMLYEIGIFDLHFGRLTWNEESGSDYDLKIAERNFNYAIRKLLSYSKNFPVEKILITVGGDFFNVNSKFNTTVKGTPQQEDSRYQKTFGLGRRLIINAIDECSSIAPVDMMFIKGNHDEERLFYLGDAVECWYHNSPNVTVDNGAKNRKYYLYGKNLLGFTHGSEEPLAKLPIIMPLEVPKLWAESTFHEWHTGDKHSRFVTKENGVVVRILGSLVAGDAWTHDKGFVGSERILESFLWDKEDGLIAQFTSSVKKDAK